MSKWVLVASGVILVGTIASLLIGQRHEGAKADRLVEALLRSESRQAVGFVVFSTFAELPSPVARYFRHVLTDGQKIIKKVMIRQEGVLRTSTTTDSWHGFTASQIVVPTVPGFLWNAKVMMPLATHVRVLDSYSVGTGSGRVSFLSSFAVASEEGTPGLNSGALHRYLAEAVWYPTALLPQSGVLWTPITDRYALATLTDRGTTVSLEFRFNDLGEVTGIYSPGRFGRFNSGYKQVPWEGHFCKYEVCAGMRVPTYGEVGWYDTGSWQAVWKGNQVDVRYELTP